MTKITACSYGLAMLVVGLVGCVQDETATPSSHSIVVATNVERLTITSGGDGSANDTLVRFEYESTSGQHAQLAVEHGDWQKVGAGAVLSGDMEDFFSAMSPEFFHRAGHDLLLHSDRLGTAGAEIFLHLPHAGHGSQEKSQYCPCRICAD